MSPPFSLHVLCRRQGGETKGLKLIDKAGHIYDSVSWRIKDDQIAALVGKMFFMHQSKAEPSYFGGEIIDIRREAVADNDDEIRAIVRFKVVARARGAKWPPTKNPNEFCHVNVSTPLDETSAR